MSVVVKGTFDLSPGDVSVAADEQLYPSGDEYYPDDEDRQGAPRYPSDFAYFKPRSDLVLAGTCYPPDGEPATRCRAVFQVGDRHRVLAVFGERTWQQQEPQPFTQMPLRYENSFGGTGYASNPIGKGLNSVTGVDGRKVAPLPNIEDPDELIFSPDQRPEPAGFGPIDQSWAQRHRRVGTYKGDYVTGRWPWFAADFDWGFFNAAPSAMQLEGYLRGDEPLYLENLHPEHAQLRGRLPGLRVRCFANVRGEADAEEPTFQEIEMRLDTLWVDMDALKLVLVWRGWMTVRSDEFDEVEHLFVVSEPVAGPAGTVADYRRLFEERRREEEQESEGEPSEPEATGEEEVIPGSVDDEMARAEEAMRERLRAAGIDPDNPPPPSKEDLEQEARILKELGFETEEAAPVAMTRPVVEERASAGVSLANEDLSGLQLRGLRGDGVDMEAANLTGAALQNAQLAGAQLAGASMAGIDLSQTDLSGADLGNADLGGGRLVGADLRGANLANANLEGADLAGAVLTGVKAQDAIFAGADLTAAEATDADFSGADFSAATLHQVDFRRSILREASLEGAVGHHVDMSGADLSELRASGACDLSYGLFCQARGPESIWEYAVLEGADFSYADVTGANFTAAVMSGANLFASNMKFASLPKARLDSAHMVQMNLFQANLEKADLTGADLRGSNLYGAETLDAILVATELAGANVKMTKLVQRGS